MDDWEYNVLGVYNHERSGKLDPYFTFIIENHDRIDGDIVEAGVFQGRSILATALVLKDLGSTKKVYGYDSFSGFPPIYHEQDDAARFDDLLAQKRISREHHDAVQRLWRYRSLGRSERPDAKTISTSGDFSDTTRSLLEEKIEFLDLGSWIEIVEGPFEKTMSNGEGPERIMAGLLDCDLYRSYEAALPFVWSRLEQGGYLFLDEYYSLKFPGARICCDQFFEDRPDKPQRHRTTPGDFERWYVRKIYEPAGEP